LLWIGFFWHKQHEGAQWSAATFCFVCWSSLLATAVEYNGMRIGKVLLVRWIAKSVTIAKGEA